MSEDNAVNKAGSIANATISQSKTELFIRSIPFEVTSTELSDFFSNVAPVKHAVVVTDHEGNSRGFGFVSFTDADDATKALEECRKQKLNDRLLKIDFAKPRVRGDDKESKPEKKPINAPVVEKRRPRLIIRNLPWSIRDPKQLEKIFAKFGNVTDVVIPRGDNGKMRGFAFVTMRKKSHADIAIEKTKNLKIAGREVAVDFAIEKNKWLNDVKGTEEYDESESEDESPKNEREEDDDDEEDNEDDENEDDDEELKDLEEQNFASPKVRLRGASTSFTVFVRNVPYDATAESLKDHFEEFGEVRYALPVMDKQLNQPKGTAFVAFATEEARNECVDNAPATATTSLLISDDVDPRYVFDGRVLAVTKAVERETATRLATASANERNKLLGKAPDEKDKRNLFLLNEGRITANSKLAEKIPASELEIRQKSYDLRKQQLNKNPSLHLSLTRLAIRNLPRAMSERALKALGRKAVVEFAKEVVEKKRQPLSKEEVIRSTKEKNSFGAVKSKHGVVRQSKIIMEQKGTGSLGRSRGYGFLEFRDHKAALMGLRWLNAHEVSIQEILEGVSEEEKKNLDLGDSKKRRLVVEFAIENAQVVKRRRDNVMKSRAVGQKRKHDDSEAGDEEENDNEEQEKDSKNKKAKNKKGAKKGNMNKGAKKNVEEKSEPKSQEEVTRLVIGKKRKMRKLKKGK
ncbi:hypothetical protein D0Z00_000992 [Geotrichum galactomycetum]|uniref:Uncharacterized protein n=1 Tax=Geotrichum galactomycetum TaxID=27317 RepID=A0ACB6V8C6_9ASCO|nr:hypothetical protein D0Z00_000992 [Geotrichum candidum]